MTITARGYQADAIAKVRTLYKQGIRRIVIVMPTGAGKTATLVLLLHAAMEKGSCVLILAHRKELIDQMSKTLDRLGIDHGIIRGNHWRTRPDLPVQVASIATLIAFHQCPECMKRPIACEVCGGKKKGNGKVRRACLACKPVPKPDCSTCAGQGKLRRPMPPAKIVAIDETHRSLANSYRWVVSECPDVFLIGLTATPWRLDGRGLHPLYDALVAPITMAALIEQGDLLPLKYYRPYSPDLSGVHTVGGDYDQEELEEAIRRDTKRIGGIVEQWLAKGENQQTLFFSVSVADAEMVAAKFCEAGVPAEALAGDTDEDLRDAMLERLASGETRVICNCQVLCEGYDLPKLGCVILGRPTKSLTMYLQQVGRCMRPHGDQKYAIVLDHAGCVDIHGLPDEPQDWTLEDRKRKKDAEERVKIECEVCGAIRPASQFQCPFCKPKQGSLFGSESNEVLELEGDLVLVDRKTTPVQLQTAIKTSSQPRVNLVCPACMSERVRVDRYRDLQFKVKCNACSKTSYVVDHETARQASEARRRIEYDYLQRVRQTKGFKAGWVSYRYRDMFGSWPPKAWAPPDDAPSANVDESFTDEFPEDEYNF